LINKDFTKGIEIKQGIWSDNTLTPYSSHSLSGKIQSTKLSLIEIAVEANTSRENTKTCIERVLREIFYKVKNVS
jgi:hypothetical protein